MDLSKTNSGHPDNLPIIGASEWVDIGSYQKIPAKIDTGAQSSSIWASNINVDQKGDLSFCLFDKPSQNYTGELFTVQNGDYKVGVIRSSNGEEQIRYRVYLPLKVNDRTIRALFSLADRSKNTFPILVGRRSLINKFLVDPSIQNVDVKELPKRHNETALMQELATDPFKFHQKYVINKERS